MEKLILASASPRRAELLRQIGVDFEALSVDIDESPLSGEQAYDYVQRLALEKAQAAQRLCHQPDVLILASDTSVIVDGQILGKPSNKKHAFEMLRALSSRTHSVLTSVAVIGKETLSVVSENHVTFSALNESDLEWYWATGEPIGKAGAYAIQGQAAIFIVRLEGSFSGVMGLPLYETSQLLQQQGCVIK